MAFDWNDYNTVAPPAAPAVAAAPAPALAAAPPAAGGFNWEDHPIVGAGGPAPASAASPATPPPSALEAFLRGGAQGATLGFSDRLAGAGGAIADKLGGSDQSLGDLYTKNQQESQQANAAAQQAHPIAYGGGNLTGGVASGLATGGLGAETAIGRIGAGAAMGGAAGVGYGHPQDLISGAEEAVKGALVGGVVGSAVEGVSSALAPSNLETFAAKRAAAALGADKAAIRRIGADQVQATGRNALDAGIVTPFASTDTMMARAGETLNKGIQGMNEVYDTLDSAGAGAINPSEVAESVDSQLSPAYRTPINRPEWSQVDNTIDSILARGEAGGNSEISLAEAQDMKNEIGQVAYPQGRTVNPALITPKQQMAQDAWGIINDAIDEAAQRGSKTINAPGIAEDLQTAKDQVGLGKSALNLLGTREAKEQGNNFFSLGDQMAAGAGYIAKGPQGLALMGIKKAILNPVGNSTAAVGADRLADVLRATPEALGPWAQQLSAAQARGGASLGVTSYILSQTSEAYREHMRALFSK